MAAPRTSQPPWRSWHPTKQLSSPPPSSTSTAARSRNSNPPGETVLSPFDLSPIPPSTKPIAHPATGDINHYDRYWFNGHQRDGAFYFGAAMGHYPVRGVIDAAFSIVRDGLEHSIFASGAMPTDRSTVIGPIRIDVVDPMRTIRYVVEPNETGISWHL